MANAPSGAGRLCPLRRPDGRPAGRGRAGLIDNAKAAKANILGLALRLGQTLTGGVVALLSGQR